MASPAATAQTPQVLPPTRTQSFHGTGLAILRSHASQGSSLSCTFTHLYFSFPLKLISPRTSSRNATLAVGENTRAIAALYIVGYGGGLVSGDCVDLDIDVGERCTLLVLTQGSTKVFKMRGSARAAETIDTNASAPIQRTSTDNHHIPCHTPPPLTTRQTMRFIISPSSTLLVLPSPVTCYQSARYLQVQRFDLRCPQTSSLILLDWITPGREYLQERDEKWTFDSYRSRNEVRVGGRVVIRDVLLLEQQQDDTTTIPLSNRTKPYSIYANLFLLGPTAQPVINSLQEEFTQIQQRVVRVVQPLLWSLSLLNALDGRKIAVVRIAGMETDQVRTWLRERLRALRSVVGDDLYGQSMW